MSRRLPLVLVLLLLLSTASVGCGQQPTDKETTGAQPSSPSPTELNSTESTMPTNPTELTMFAITDGDVFLMRAGTRTWVEAQIGMTLETGDAVKAGDDSWAIITFFEGSVIELEAGATVNVIELDIVDVLIPVKEEISKLLVVFKNSELKNH